MKIILSRKGFDSGYGKQPSPILPDGTLLSLPIPIAGNNTFSDLFHDGETYFKLIQKLRPTTKISSLETCHLDKDIRKSAIKQRPENWKPIFGQCDAAQSHLKNNGVGIGDIFLFFGWFKQTEIFDDKLRYKPQSPDLHIIYGYLQIGEMYKFGDKFPDYSQTHPHTTEAFKYRKNNCIYVARENLSLNENLKGADCLKYNPNLILTKIGFSRGKWELPFFFTDLTMTYHSKRSFKEDHFKSADKGQEFVIDANDDLIIWVKKLIEQY